MSKGRPCIEVDPNLYESLTVDNKKDPFELFVVLLKEESNATEEVKATNKNVIINLLSNGHISKSSIIWQNDRIVKIYGLKVGADGRIKYEKHRSPERKPPINVADAHKVNFTELKNAIIRVKQGFRQQETAV